mgnify:CR=1 FL=1
MSIGNPGKSLNIHAPWHEVLRLLGINVQVAISGQQVEITDSLREHVQRNPARIDRYFWSSNMK